MLMFDHITNLEDFQGVKSVFGMVEGSYLGFSTEGHAKTAAKAAKAGLRYVVTLGSGGATSSCAGRITNLVELSGDICNLRSELMPAHHKTALVNQWPFACVLEKVYLVEGTPSLKLDLGFIDLLPMTSNIKGVVTVDPFRSNVFSALRTREVMVVPVPARGHA